MWEDIDQEQGPDEIIALISRGGYNVKVHQPGIQINFSIQEHGPIYTFWMKSFKLFVDGSTLVAHGKDQVRNYLMDYM